MTFSWVLAKTMWTACLIGNLYFMQKSDQGGWWRPLHFSLAILSALYLLGII